MKAEYSAFSFLIVFLLFGCGVSKKDYALMEKRLERVIKNSDELEGENERLEGENERLVKATDELHGLKSETNRLRKEIDELKNQETFLFAKASQLFNSGDLFEALAAYTHFVRTFPASTRLDSAKFQMGEVRKQIDIKLKQEQVKREEEAKQIAVKLKQEQVKREEEAQKERNLQKKLRSGELTLNEIHMILVPDSVDSKRINDGGIIRIYGFTGDEVIKLLGHPSINTDGMTRNPDRDDFASPSMTWGHPGKWMCFDPILNKKRPFYVFLTKPGYRVIEKSLQRIIKVEKLLPLRVYAVSHSSFQPY